MSPRDLKTDMLTRMICVEGIVTKTSLVRPKILRSIHYCPDGSKKYYYKDYVDMLSASENTPPTSTSIPVETGSRRTSPLLSPPEEALEFEYGYSTYVNFQTISIQEMPERAPFGQVPLFLPIFPAPSLRRRDSRLRPRRQGEARRPRARNSPLFLPRRSSAPTRRSRQRRRRWRAVSAR